MTPNANSAVSDNHEMAAPSFYEPRRGFELASAKTIAVQGLPTSCLSTIAMVHGSDIHLF